MIGGRPDYRPGSRPGNRPGNVVIGNRPGGGHNHIGNNNINFNHGGWNNNWNHHGWGWNGGRPGPWNGYPGYGYPGYGRYGWYNGNWGGGYWGGGRGWYRPYAYGVLTGWGLSGLAGGWGYNYGPYYNPYYVGLTGGYATTYNYSQPVVVYNYAMTDDSGVAASAVAPPSDTDPGMQEFNQGLAAFKNGDYEQSLTFFDAAVQKQPKDPVIHEVRALALFAVGAYQPAAAALNSLLSVAPGMDWTTASGLYGNINDYTTQLRALESHCRANPKDAAAYFVLAYQYMVTGATKEAASTLQIVVDLQPQDVVAKQLLDSLTPPAEAPAAVTPALAVPPAVAESTPVETDEGPETDLVGAWQASAGDTTIQLSITEDSKFTWKSTPKGQPEVVVNGDISITDDGLLMSSKEQGNMGGSVTSLGPDKWRFQLAGAPENDPGLVFERKSP